MPQPRLAPHRPSRTPGTSSFRARLLLWRMRVGLVALLLGAAATLAVAELKPPPEATSPVLVASEDLEAGTELAPGDVQLTAWPDSLVRPEGAVSISAVTGRRLAVAVPAGLPVVEGVLAADGFDAPVPHGTVVAPVRLADPAVAALLRPGDRVDVLGDGSDAPLARSEEGDSPDDASADTAGSARILARGALVVAGQTRLDGSADALGALRATAQDATEPLVLLAVAPADARALAAAGAWADLTVAILP